MLLSPSCIQTLNYAFVTVDFESSTSQATVHECILLPSLATGVWRYGDGVRGEEREKDRRKAVSNHSSALSFFQGNQPVRNVCLLMVHNEKQTWLHFQSCLSILLLSGSPFV